MRSNSCSRLSTLGSRLRRSAVTLIELLVVLLIISLLAGLILGVASVAGEAARENHSRHVVERLHTLLVDYYDSLQSRRVRLAKQTLETPDWEKEIQAKLTGAKRGYALAQARLYALRELVLMEIPDRWSDVILTDVGLPTQGTDDTSPPQMFEKTPLYLIERTDLSWAYLRRYKSLIGRKNSVSEKPNTAGDIKTNQGAECLYMVITLATGDGEARAQFHESTIGDTDGDGAPEFVDGWGHPIEFLRWAPGYDSAIQLNRKPTDADLAKDHDPFDVFRADPEAYRLVPLIYSAGRDESYGLYVGPDPGAAYVAWRKITAPSVSTNGPYYLSPRLTPYNQGLNGWGSNYLGDNLNLVDPNQFDNTAADNIDNHLMGLR